VSGPLPRGLFFQLRVIGGAGAIARQSSWQVRVIQDGKGSRGIGIMPLMIVAGKLYVSV
jgi:hypothetical protein